MCNFITSVSTGIIVDLKNEKLQLEQQKTLIENKLKVSKEREKKSLQTIKNIHTRLETVESEKSYLVESINGLKDDLDERDQKVEKIKMQMKEANDQMAHFKHEYNLSVEQLKVAKAQYQHCTEMESNVKDRFVKCKHQIDETNRKLASKIAEVVTLLKKIRKLEKQNRELKREKEQTNLVLKNMREEMNGINLENNTNKETLRENDARFVKMKSQLDKILRERDLIANQMVRRTDENELLTREVETLKLSIERGNGMYNERVDDIKLMTNEIKSLRSQCNVLKRGLQNTADMRHEVMRLHRKLNQERTKAKVLEQEMVTPMNVHRWRKLHHHDPKRSEMLKKCQRLQRNNLIQSTRIAKSEEIIEVLNEKIALLEKESMKRPIVAVQEKLMVTRVSF